MTLDAANMIAWLQSADAVHNRHRPESVYERLSKGKEASDDYEGMTIEEFDRWYSEKMGVT